MIKWKEVPEAINVGLPSEMPAPWLQSEKVGQYVVEARKRKGGVALRIDLVYPDGGNGQYVPVAVSELETDDEGEVKEEAAAFLDLHFQEQITDAKRQIYLQELQIEKFERFLEALREDSDD